MANTFKLFIKQDGTYQEVNAVFPFTSGELLDERLDEAKVVFFSEEEAYKPLTEIKVEFNESGTDSEEYYILANDNAAEYPAGSGVYKHEAYLIERTKLLEGVVCPSLTFTNSLPRNYSPIQMRLNPEILDGSAESMDGWTYSGTQYFYSPISKNVQHIFASSRDVGVSAVDFIEEKYPMLTFTLLDRDYNDSSKYTHATVMTKESDGTYTSELEFFYNEPVVLSTDFLSNKQEIRILYTIAYYQQGGDVAYTMQLLIAYDFEVVNTYLPALAPWTITECVNRVLECAEPVFVYGVAPQETGEDTGIRFKFEGVRYFNDGKGGLSIGSTLTGQALKYKDVLAPEFSMTQATLREQLKVIGSFIHAEPYIADKDNSGAYIIKFLDYGSQKAPTGIGGNTPYISNTLKSDINGFCTDVRSNSQNLINSLSYAKGGSITEPHINFYRALQTERQYVRIESGNGYAATDYPIYDVEKVECGVIDKKSDLNISWQYGPVDITPYVFEATEYGANLESVGGGYPYSKRYAIYYTIGQKGLQGLFYQSPDAVNTAANSPYAIANILSACLKVNVSEIYGTIMNNAATLAFNITYKPIAPAFISHGKQLYVEGEKSFSQIYNQSENLIETNFFGENLKGVAARLGNIEQERTYMLSSRSLIPNVGEMIDGYAISAVYSEYMTNYIKCTLGLTKDFNRISEYVGVNSVKRMYEISERQAQERDILIKEQIVITTDSTMKDDKYVIFEDKRGFIWPLLQTWYSSDLLVKGAFFKPFNKALEPINTTSYTYYSGLLLPVLTRSFGNSVHLSFKLKDNYSAGNNSTYVSGENNVSGRWQTDVPYTDFYGRIYYAGICFPTGLISGSNGDGGIIDSSFRLPSNYIGKIGASNVINPSALTEALSDTEMKQPSFRCFHRVRKDNREILTYNVEAELCTTEPNLIIGSELAAKCRYINKHTLGGVQPSPELYFTNTPINKLSARPDLSIAGKDSGLVITELTNGIRISSPLFRDYPNTYKYWVLVTPVSETTEEYNDEAGGTVTITTKTGGELLLGGTTDMFGKQDPLYPYAVDLYFRTKRR